jgi:hypothetical protein
MKINTNTVQDENRINTKLKKKVCSFLIYKTNEKIQRNADLRCRSYMAVRLTVTLSANYLLFLSAV